MPDQDVRSLVFGALRDQLRTIDVETLPLETLLQLAAVLSQSGLVAGTKETCVCEVLDVDDDARRAAGWQCRCFRLTAPNRKMSSFKGPGFTHWVGGTSGALSPRGNLTENVVDPQTGEVFVVEYKCTCE